MIHSVRGLRKKIKQLAQLEFSNAILQGHKIQHVRKFGTHKINTRQLPYSIVQPIIQQYVVFQVTMKIRINYPKNWSHVMSLISMLVNCEKGYFDHCILDNIMNVYSKLIWNNSNNQCT